MPNLKFGRSFASNLKVFYRDRLVQSFALRGGPLWSLGFVAGAVLCKSSSEVDGVIGDS